MKPARKTINYQACALLLFVVASLSVKLFQIGHRSFSLDELYGVCAALEPNFKDFLNQWVLYDSNPPLYYFFLRGWLQFFPATEFWVRLPSVLAVLAALYFFVNGIKNRFGNDTWIWLLLLCGSSYGFLFFAQEARAYAFLFLFTVLQLLLFIDLLRSETPRLTTSKAIGFTVLSILSAYCHYTGIIFSAILLLFLFACHYRNQNIFWQLSLMVIVAFAAGLPWISYFLIILKIDKSFIINQDYGIVKEIFSMLFFGYRHFGKIVSMILLLMLPVLVFLNFENIKNTTRTNKMLLCLGLLAACIIAASPCLPYFYYYRHYMVLLPVLLLSVAVLLALRKVRLWVKLTIIFLAMGVVAEQGFTHYLSKREAWRQSVQYVVRDNAGKANTVIIIGEPWEQNHLDYLMKDPGYLNLAIRRKTFYQYYFSRFDPKQRLHLEVSKPEMVVLGNLIVKSLKQSGSVYILCNGGEFAPAIAKLKFGSVNIRRISYPDHVIFKITYR